MLFTYANLALKTSAAKVLNSGVVIYSCIVMIMISKFLFKLTNGWVIICFFLTKLLTLGILFSTAVNAVFVVKLLTSRILLFNSVSFVSLTKSVTSGVFFSNSPIF